MVNKTLYRKLKIEQHEPYSKLQSGVNLGIPVITETNLGIPVITETNLGTPVITAMRRPY